MEDMDGNLLETHHLSREAKTIPVCDKHSRPWPFYADRHEILFESGEIPAGGYKMYRIRNSREFNRKTEFWALTRTTEGKELATSATRMENQYIVAEVQQNGTISLLDKSKNCWYRDLNYFESTGDVGDYWMYYPPYKNQTYSSKGLSCRTWLEENTPLQATIAVEINMEIPAHGYRPEKYHIGESRRSNQTAVVSIITRYTLKKDEKQLDVNVCINNTAKDHRMNVSFDTGIQTDYVVAEGHFCVDHRPRLPLKDELGAYYNELLSQPMQRFVGLENAESGFAVINKSMCEYEAKNGPEGTLSLTLFRAVRNIICTEWRSAAEFPNQQGAQLQQKLDYQYSIIPYGGDWEKEDILTSTRQLNQPVGIVQTSKRINNNGKLPTSTSFYDVGEKLQLSALKKKEDSHNIVMRIYNPYRESVTQSVYLNNVIQKAWFLDLKEERLQEILLQENELVIEVKPDKIVTIEIEVCTK